MTSLSKIPSDFSTPKVRDSFVSKFVYEAGAQAIPEEDEEQVQLGITFDT